MYPAFAFISCFFFPKRCASFQVFHKKTAGIKCLRTMRRPCGGEYDRLARQNIAKAVNDQTIIQGRLELLVPVMSDGAINQGLGGSFGADPRQTTTTQNRTIGSLWPIPPVMRISFGCLTDAPLPSVTQEVCKRKHPVWANQYW